MQSTTLSSFPLSPAALPSLPLAVPTHAGLCASVSVPQQVNHITKIPAPHLENITAFLTQQDIANLTSTSHTWFSQRFTHTPQLHRLSFNHITDIKAFLGYYYSVLGAAMSAQAQAFTSPGEVTRLIRHSNDFQAIPHLTLRVNASFDEAGIDNLLEQMVKALPGLQQVTLVLEETSQDSYLESALIAFKLLPRLTHLSLSVNPQNRDCHSQCLPAERWQLTTLPSVTIENVDELNGTPFGQLKQLRYLTLTEAQIMNTPPQTEGHGWSKEIQICLTPYLTLEENVNLANTSQLHRAIFNENKAQILKLKEITSLLTQEETEPQPAIVVENEAYPSPLLPRLVKIEEITDKSFSEEEAIDTQPQIEAHGWSKDLHICVTPYLTVEENVNLANTSQLHRAIFNENKAQILKLNEVGPLLAQEEAEAKPAIVVKHNTDSTTHDNNSTTALLIEAQSSTASSTSCDESFFPGLVEIEDSDLSSSEENNVKAKAKDEQFLTSKNKALASHDLRDVTLVGDIEIDNDANYSSMPIDSLEQIKRLRKILAELQLTEERLAKAGINWEMLDKVMHPSRFGQLIHFLVSTSLTRALLLFPFLDKAGIKTTHTQRTERLNLSLNSIVADSIEDDFLIIEPKHNPQTPLIDHNKRSYLSRFLWSSSPLLFESKRVLKQVYAINAFHETVEVMIEGVWSALLSSLLINGIVNFYLYPEENEGATLWNVFGLTSLLNMLCIEKIAFFEEYFCFKSGEQYEEVLASSLDELYVWPVLLGAPLLLGALNGLRESTHAKALSQKQIQKIINELKEHRHKAGFCRDVMGWMVSSMIPDLLSAIIPPFVLFGLLPQPKIKHALEKIGHGVLWDGRLTAEQRRKLFDRLLKFSAENQKITQMKALSTLAEIVEGIQLSNLKTLQKERVEKEIIQDLLLMKAQAFKELHALSQHASLQEDDAFTLSLLPRFLYANYLSWKIGHVEHAYLQPLFFAYKAFKLYFTLMFYKAIVGGLIEVINRKLEEKECKEAGKVWLWYEEFEKHLCSVCGDLPVLFRDIFTIEDCFRGLMSQPRTVAEIVNFTNRFDLKNITELSFLRQKFDRTTVGQYASLLNQIKGKFPSLKKLDTTVAGEIPLVFADVLILAINNFIRNTTIKSLTLYKLYSNNITSFEELIETAVSLNISTLELIGLGFPYNQSLNHFVHSIQNSNIQHFSLIYPDFFGKKNYNALFESLPSSNIKEFLIEFGSDLNLDNCLKLAEKLPFSKVQYLNFIGSGIRNSSASCAEALANAIGNISTDFSLTLSEPEGGFGFANGLDSGDAGIKAFAKLLAKKPNIKSLSIATSNLTQATLLELIHNIPKSDLEELNIDMATNYAFFPQPLPIYPFINYTIVIPQLINAINQSKITKLRLWGNGDSAAMSDEGLRLLAAALPTKLSKLVSLQLPTHRIGDEGLKSLAKALPNTRLQSLDLSYNNINQGLLTLGQYLNQTQLIEINLRFNRIQADTVVLFSAYFKDSKLTTVLLCCQCSWVDFCKENHSNQTATIVKNLQGSSIRILDIRDFPIFDNDAISIAKFLVTPGRKPLWIESGHQNLRHGREPATNLTQFKIGMPENGIEINNASLQAFCDVLSYTNIDLPLFLDGVAPFYHSPPFNQTIIDNCGIISSANSLHPIGPYYLLFRLYQAVYSSLSSIGNHVFFDKTIEHPVPSTALPLKETSTALINIVDDTIDNESCFNNDAAIEVLHAENQDHQYILYMNLLGVCETFFNAISRSALFTAVPLFATEILHQLGGHDRESAEQYGKEIQTLLILSLIDAPTAIAASYIAHWLVSRITTSPNVILMASTGASIAAGISSAVFNHHASLGWMALQTSAALMGSVIGSYGVSSGLNAIKETAYYVGNQINYLTQDTQDNDNENSSLSKRD